MSVSYLEKTEPSSNRPMEGSSPGTLVNKIPESAGEKGSVILFPANRPITIKPESEKKDMCFSYFNYGKKNKKNDTKLKKKTVPLKFFSTSGTAWVTF